MRDMAILINLLSISAITNVFCFAAITKKNSSSSDDDRDNTPVDETAVLLLTPFIEDGQLSEARNASRVDPDLFLGIESYSGFLTVNKTHKSHLFFWYFPSFNKPVDETPWIIWLQGGPGSSSLNGLFQEIGPFMVNFSGDLYENPHSWLVNHSLVFIDNPVGTGYSFTQHKDGYAKDMDTYGSQLHHCVNQLVQLFPELRLAPLFVAGESYAGHYAPALSVELHRNKNVPGFGINFKGLMVGNGLFEPEMLTQSYKAYHHAGLLDHHQIDTLNDTIEALQGHMDNNNTDEAFYALTYLNEKLKALSSLKNSKNYRRDKPLFTGYYTMYLNRSEVKHALHVGGTQFATHRNKVKMDLLRSDFFVSTRPLVEELLEHYRVLMYCGALDLMVPCIVSSERIRAWNWTHSQQFRKANSKFFYFNGTTVGNVTSGGGLTWAVFQDAGHMVPGEVPAQAQDFVTRYTHDLPLPLP